MISDVGWWSIWHCDIAPLWLIIPHQPRQMLLVTHWRKVKWSALVQWWEWGGGQERKWRYQKLRPLISPNWIMWNHQFWSPPPFFKAGNIKSGGNPPQLPKRWKRRSCWGQRAPKKLNSGSDRKVNYLIHLGFKKRLSCCSFCSNTVMLLAVCIVVLACVMVSSHFMVWAFFMAFYSVMILDCIKVLACVLRCDWCHCTEAWSWDSEGPLNFCQNLNKNMCHSTLAWG